MIQAFTDIVTPPAVEPVTTVELKAHLKVEHSDEDDIIAAVGQAARETLEHYCGRPFINTTFNLTLAEFKNTMRLRAAVQSVTHVKYYDADDLQQTLATSVYSVLKPETMPGGVRLKFNQSWPVTRERDDAIEIQYVAGFGSDADDVPFAIKQAILLVAANLYENRQLINNDPMSAVQNAAKSLCNRWHVGSV